MPHSHRLEPLLPQLLHVAEKDQREATIPVVLEAYLDGAADSALSHFREALWVDPERVDAWMMVGQTYRHLIPMEPNQDSLSLDAFERVRDFNPAFTPVLFYLIAHYARIGRVAEAAELLDELRAAEPDPANLRISELLVRCAAETPQAIDWDRETEEVVDVVFQVARILHIGASNPECAIAGWRAVVRSQDPAHVNHRFTAAMQLQNLLAGLGRVDELTAFLDNDAPFPTNRWLYITDALAGVDVGDRAEHQAESLRARLWEEQRSFVLWFLATWDLHAGRLDEARAILDTLSVNLTAETAVRRDTVVTHSITAHLALAEGDTTEALRLLRSLRPVATRPNLTWDPWESLGYEWLVLARLLEARGELEEALRVATIADTPRSAANLVFRQANVALRARLARALGDTELSNRLGRAGPQPAQQ